MPIFSPSTIRSLWQERRVLLRLIGQEIGQLPDSSEEGAFIPADPAAREWLFDIYAATLLQSIGRARGINHDKDEPLEIRLYGCLINPGMDAALSRSMITISDTTKYKGIPRVNDPRERIRAAIEEVARGPRGPAGVSRRSVAEHLVRDNMKARKAQIISDEIRAWKFYKSIS